MKGLKKDLEEPMDNVEQYYRRQCLVFMGIEEKERIIPIRSFCQLDCSHRMGPPKFDDKSRKVNCLIIAKFCSYRTRKLIFSNKKKSKKSGFVTYENLTKRKMESFTQAKKIAGARNVWTKDGNIFSFNKQNKVFTIGPSKDLDNLKCL